MAKIVFKIGSTPYTLHEHFMSGGSLTHDEAYDGKCGERIRNLPQRIKDLQLKFEEANAVCPLMYIDEPNEYDERSHRRYFYRGFGCPHENDPEAKAYGE
ncbi:MAG: hypothetical protein AB1763_04925 [Campylobacterota bacterium]